jgi:hypothetical protein
VSREQAGKKENIMSAYQAEARLARVVMAAAVMIFASGLAAVTPAEARGGRQHDHQAADADQKEQPGSTAATHDMKAMREKMMADNRAADATLEPLIEKMNTAKGEAKVDAMAAVVAELVRQHSDMRRRMEQMSEKMPEMAGMMMQRMSGDVHKMAEQCPMMKEMPTSPPKQ